jgi:hypothetical protein
MLIVFTPDGRLLQASSELMSQPSFFGGIDAFSLDSPTESVTVGVPQ